MNKIWSKYRGQTLAVLQWQIFICFRRWSKTKKGFFSFSRTKPFHGRSEWLDNVTWRREHQGRSVFVEMAWFGYVTCLGHFSTGSSVLIRSTAFWHAITALQTWNCQVNVFAACFSSDTVVCWTNRLHPHTVSLQVVCNDFRFPFFLTLIVSLSISETYHNSSSMTSGSRF